VREKKKKFYPQIQGVTRVQIENASIDGLKREKGEHPTT
jgi:hypothetical protein